MVIGLFFPVIVGGLISWIITHFYYKKELENQKKRTNNLSKKLSKEVKEVILSQHKENLSIQQLNQLLQKKVIKEDDIGSDPLPYKACPKCGNEELYKTSDIYRDDVYYFVKCEECGWNEWTM